MITLIEIILRNDIKDYEPRPLFGHTYREVASALAIGLASSLTAVALVSAGVTGTPMLIAVLAVGGLIGFVGLGRIGGLRFEQWAAIRREYRSWPRVALYSPVILDPASARREAMAKPSRKARRALARLASEAACESELLMISAREGDHADL